MKAAFPPNPLTRLWDLHDVTLETPIFRAIAWEPPVTQRWVYFKRSVASIFLLCKTERGKATWYERNPRETQVSEKTVALVDQSGGTEMCFRFSVWGAAFDSLDSYSKGFFHFSFDISLRLPADVLTIHTDNSRFCCIHCYVPYVAVY